jgi:hypothetical protein
MCFVVCKTNSKLEHVILTTLFLSVQKTPTQVQQEYDCNNEKMAEYLAEVQRMEKFFDGFGIWYVPWLDNRNTDHLAWIASSGALTPADVIIQKLSKPSVKPAEPTSEVNEQDLMVINEPE